MPYKQEHHKYRQFRASIHWKQNSTGDEMHTDTLDGLWLGRPQLMYLEYSTSTVPLLPST